ASGLLEGALGGPELFCEQSLVVVYAAMDLVFCDRLDDAERLCSAVIEAGERGGSPSLVATFAFPRAFARLRRGALRDAEADGRWESLHCHSANASRWRADAALALARQGELERAHELATEQLRLAEQSGPPRALGIATRALGTVTVRRGGVTLLSEAGHSA